MKKVSLLTLVCLLFIGILYSCIKDHNIPDSPKVLTIEGVAKVEFPVGSIKSDIVTFKKTTSTPVELAFDETLELFRVGPKLPYQIKLDIGNSPPQNESINIVINLPVDFVNSVPNNYGIELFALAYQNGGDEILDLFDIIPSQYHPFDNTLTATLPIWVFTSERNINKTFEAFFKVGATPGKNSGMRLAATADECLAGQIYCPIGSVDNCTDKAGSGFGLRDHPTQGAVKPHWGVDFIVPLNTPIFAVSDGSIAKVHTQVDSNGNVTGFGLYVIVRHTNGSASLYAHLTETILKVGDKVAANEQIGLSGGIPVIHGTSTGPHLHFEYVPNGEIINSKSRIDPLPCISGNANGSVTVRDNGNLADDAFLLVLDNIPIGSTQIGASNSIALSNIRPGEHLLKLVCTVAPDNVGTYEVLLNSGIVFKDGGVTRSSTIPQGGSAEWSIIVPTVRTLNLAPNLSKPNDYIER